MKAYIQSMYQMVLMHDLHYPVAGIIGMNVIGELNIPDLVRIVGELIILVMTIFKVKKEKVK